MKELLIFGILLLAAVILGCTQQAPAANNTTVAPSVNATQAPAANMTTPSPSNYSVINCTLLTTNDIKNVVGLAVKNETFYPGGDRTCSRSWVDLKNSSYAVVALVVSLPDASAAKENLDFSCSEHLELEQIGDYCTSWFENTSAVNFGKGAYELQIQCLGINCSQAKAIELAKIIANRI